MEKNKAARYMPTQKRRGWIPPIEAMVLLFIGSIAFQRLRIG